MSLTCWDVADGEQADTRVTIHRPLLCLTVGLTAVVHEARVVSFWASVDDSVLTVTNRWPQSVICSTLTVYN